MFVVALMGKRLVDTVMAGYEGHRGWINYLAVAPKYVSTPLIHSSKESTCSKESYAPP